MSARISANLDGEVAFRTHAADDSNHSALYIDGADFTSVGITRGVSEGHAANAAFWRYLASHAEVLAEKCEAMLEAEKAAVSPAVHYTCTGCGAAFGMAGDEDGSYDQADAFREDVEHHESGACRLTLAVTP
jgi:hypothetical protein